MPTPRRSTSYAALLAVIVATTLAGARAHAQDTPPSDDSPAPPPLPPSPRAAPPAPRAPIRMTVDKSKVDLHAHHLEVVATNPLVKVTTKVIGDSGAVLADESRTLENHPAGVPLLVQWTPSGDESAARIEVTGYDANGSYWTTTLTPWSVSIPHEEVNFKTASWQIDDTETPKLEASFAKVTLALGLHPDLRATLFIAGHTDTVGDAASNLRLSRQRALAIAGWFRQHGLTIPIAYEGFGSSVLLVRTADQVDEPRNRRVDYILSMEEPQFASRGSFRPRWSRVP